KLEIFAKFNEQFFAGTGRKGAIHLFILAVHDQAACGFQKHIVLLSIGIVDDILNQEAFGLYFFKNLWPPFSSSVLSKYWIDRCRPILMKGNPVIGKNRIRSIQFLVIFHHDYVNPNSPQFCNKSIEFFLGHSVDLLVRKLQTLLKKIIDSGLLI